MAQHHGGARHEARNGRNGRNGKHPRNEEMNEEDQVQGTHEDQLSHVLTDALKTTEITKNENVGTSKEEKDVMENPAQVENTEPLKDDFTEAGGE